MLSNSPPVRVATAERLGDAGSFSPVHGGEASRCSPANSKLNLAGVRFIPRLFYEDATIWSTVCKLKRALEVPEIESRLYIEALGVVLVHELVRLNRGARRVEAPARGGLAVWQQRTV